MYFADVGSFEKNKLTNSFSFAWYRSMGSHEMSPQRLSKRISGVPAEFVKHHLGSPTGFKMFSPIDSVDGTELTVTRVKFDVILKGFSLGASLLPSLRAGYKVNNDIPRSAMAGVRMAYSFSLIVF